MDQSSDAAVIIHRIMPLTLRSISAIFAIFLLSAGCARRQPTVATTPPPPSVPLAAEGPAGSCKSIDGVPDSACTPANIKATLCVAGYTKTVRPPTTYTNALKAQHVREYGCTDTNPKDYEEDHFIPLELGGNPTDPANLWPEPGPSPNPKDPVEGKLNRLVCARTIRLAEAQTRIRTNWKTAIQRMDSCRLQRLSLRQDAADDPAA
jgi:hypothetical protein